MYIKINRSQSSPLLSRSNPTSCIKPLEPINLNDSAFFENESTVTNTRNQKSINVDNKTVTSSQKLKEHDHINLMINPLTTLNLDNHKATFPPSQENKTSYVESFIKQQKRIFENEVETERIIKEEIQSIVSFGISLNNSQEEDWLSTLSSSTNDPKPSKYNPILLKQDSTLYKNKGKLVVEGEEEEEIKSENTILMNKVKNITAIKNKCIQTLSRWIKPKLNHHNINKYNKEEEEVDNDKLNLKDSNIKIIISPAAPSTSPTLIDDYPLTTQNIHSLKINKMKRNLSWSVNTPLEEYKNKKGWKGSSPSPLLSPPLSNYKGFQFKKSDKNSNLIHDFQNKSNKSNLYTSLQRINLTSASQFSQSTSSIQKNYDNSNKSSLSLFDTTASTVSSKQKEDNNYKKISGMSFLQRTLSNARKINLKSPNNSKRNQNQKNSIITPKNIHGHEVNIIDNNHNNMDNYHESNTRISNHNNKYVHELMVNKIDNTDNDDVYHHDDKKNIGLFTTNNKSTHFEVYSPKLKSFNEEEIASTVLKNSGLDYFQFPKMDPIQVKI